MIRFNVRSFILPLLAAITIAMAGQFALAQEPTSPTTANDDLYTRASEAFSGNHDIHHVRMKGNATWHAGSLIDTGTATLTASSDGSSSLFLELSDSGQKVETQKGSGVKAQCQWSAKDGVMHDVKNISNCAQPVIWFLPSMSLNSALKDKKLKTSDAGIGTLGSEAKTHRRLHSQTTDSAMPSALVDKLFKNNTADIGFNSETFLPNVLTFSQNTDDNHHATLNIEVRFSDYRAIHGVQIPHTIQRYVNGSLQLEINISSAEIN